MPALMTTANEPTAPAPLASFRHPLRVYWEDTDAGGVVFYANYLKFFERARTEWLRALGFGQQQLRERTGAIFVVTDTHVRYRAPARLDDLLEVTVELRAAGKASMTLVQRPGAVTHCWPKATSASAVSTKEPSGRAAFPPS